MKQLLIFCLLLFIAGTTPTKAQSKFAFHTPNGATSTVAILASLQRQQANSLSHSTIRQSDGTGT